ncbi:MAG TPA: 30S ribosomal protein S17 [Pyrinomonadaceae bacterium]|nr:30S ribosomal protein S17 [Pyrinomonadaceae bacterium]
MATKKKTEEEVEGTGAAETVETEAAPAEAVEAKAETAVTAEEKPKRTRKTAAETEKTEKKADDSDGSEKKKGGKRAERIGVVSSDKMTKTVVVRVDRLVKHPIYRKYVRRRKKFMAHDELGAKIGDKVKIVATRPLSARKRWRVVEIIQKAEL